MKKILTIIITILCSIQLLSQNDNITTPAKNSIVRLNEEFQIKYELIGTESPDDSLYVIIQNIANPTYDKSNQIKKIVNAQTSDGSINVTITDESKINLDGYNKVYFLGSNSAIVAESKPFFVYDSTESKPFFIKILSVKNITKVDSVKIDSLGNQLVSPLNFSSDVQDSIKFEWVDNFPDNEKVLWKYKISGEEYPNETKIDGDVSISDSSNIFTWAIPSDLLNSLNYKVFVGNDNKSIIDIIEMPIIGKSLKINTALLNENNKYYWHDTIKVAIDNSMTKHVDSVKVEFYNVTSDSIIVAETLLNAVSDIAKFYLEPDPEKYSVNDTFKVVITDAELSILSDTSNNFTIKPKTIKIISPSANDSLIIGRKNKKAVKWNADNVDEFSFGYKLTTENSWTSEEFIDINFVDDRTYNWDIPKTFNEGTYKIKIEDANNPKIADSSEVFQVINKSITITSPSDNGAEFLYGHPNKIEWTYKNVNTVIVQYPLQAESNWIGLDTISTQDSLFYSWNINNENLIDTNVTIRVIDKNDPLTFDEKNVTILEKSIDLISPNEDSKFIIGRENEIKWNDKYNNIDAIKIYQREYNENNPAKWDLLIFTDDNDNSTYIWDIASNFTPGKYQIKIEDAKHPVVYDSTGDNEYFEIINKSLEFTEDNDTIFFAGDTVTLNWNYENVDSVVLSYNYDNKGWVKIEPTIQHEPSSTKQSFPWAIDGTWENDKTILIAIEDPNDLLSTDTLSAKILRKEISIISAGVNDTLIIGQENEIIWTSPVANSFNISLNDTLINRNNIVVSDSLSYDKQTYTYVYSLLTPPNISPSGESSYSLIVSDATNSSRADTLQVNLILPFIEITLPDNVLYSGVKYPIELNYSQDLGKIELYYMDKDSSFLMTPNTLDLVGINYTDSLRIALSETLDNIDSVRIFVEPQNSGNTALAKDSSEIFSIRQIPIPEIDSSLLADSNLTLLTSSTPKLMWSVNDENITKYAFRISTEENNLDSVTPFYISKTDTIIENLVPGESYHWSIASIIEGGIEDVTGDSSVASFKVYNTGDVIIQGLPIVTEVPKTKDIPLEYLVDYSNYVLDTNSVTVGLFLKRGGYPFTFYPAVNDRIIITDNMINPEGIIFIPTLLLNEEDTTFLTKLFYSVKAQSNFSETINVSKSTPSSDGLSTNWHFFGSSINNLTIENVFSDTLGDTRDPVWRLLEWNNSTKEYVDVDNMKDYKGYFFAHTKDNFSIKINEAYLSRSLFDSTLALNVDDTSWVSFASPFVFDVPFYTDKGSIIKYDNSSGWQLLNNGDALHPFTGYFAQGIDTLKFITNPLVQKYSSNNSVELWKLEFGVNAGNKRITRSVSLQDPSLEKGTNVFHEYKNVNSPPNIDNSFIAKLSIDGKNELLKSTRFSTEGGVWSIELTNNSKGKLITISKDIIGVMPDNYNSVLFNKASGEIYSKSDIQIYLDKNGSVNFKIVVGKQEYIDEQIELFEKSIPTEFSLKQNYPNPFNPSTVIEYSLPENSHVKIGIYNILGERVTELVNGIKDAGNYSVFWNGTDKNSNKVSSGVYFYSIETENYYRIKKMVLLK